MTAIRSSIVTAAAIVAMCVSVTAVHAALPNKCAYYKEKYVAKKASDFLNCDAKVVRGFVLGSACVDRASARFASHFAAIEQKLSCYTTNDVGSMENEVDDFVLDVVQTLDPSFPTASLNRCSSSKITCVRRELYGILGCYAKAVKRGFLVDPTCVARYRTKFDGGTDPTRGCFAKLEAKYGATCPTTGDTSDFETKVDDFVTDVASKLEPLCGNNSIESPFETCDGTEDSACPGLCKPPGVAFACTCPFCGDGALNQATEVCDGDDDAACPAHCDVNCGCAVCGNNVTEPYPEDCDGTDDASCPGQCGAPGASNECRCPLCGDGVVDQPTEECDGNSGACPFHCATNCLCAVCGNDVIEPDVETCDGTSDSACPGSCLPPGDVNQCRCPVCGDNAVNQASEECDGADDTACPGQCSAACQCAVCGNFTAEPPVEQCDGLDDAACPGSCLPPGDANECRCGPFCGDDVVNQSWEQCDGFDDSACPGQCLPPGDLLECMCPTCGDGVVNQGTEQCDGFDDGACPGACLPDCTCP
jgi:hypothetical protein